MQFPGVTVEVHKASPIVCPTHRQDADSRHSPLVAALFQRFLPQKAAFPFLADGPAKKDVAVPPH